MLNSSKNVFLKFICFLILSIFVSSCANNLDDKQNNLDDKQLDYSEVIKHLNSEKDGFSAYYDDDLSFIINSTFANSEKICRVVTLEISKKSNKVETFCKIKGGNWN